MSFVVSVMPYAFRKLILYGAVSLLFSIPLTLCAQETGRIVGEVRVIRGDFPGRILVELQFRGAPIASRYTDEQGNFEFDSLVDDAYRVVIRDEHYYPVDELAVLNTAISTITTVSINLTRREAVQKEPLPNRDNGSNPYMVDLAEYRRQFPKKAVKEFERGLDSDRKGKRDEGIRHYEKALSLAPDFYPAHNNLGSDYLAKRDFKSAQDQFEQAIKLNQSDAQAHLNLANLLLMTKNYEGALSSVQEGLKRQPNSPLGQFLLGSIYERLGKFPEAERALRQTLELAPKMSRVRLELVNLYLAQQKKAEATAELKAFLKDSPDDPLAPKVKEALNKLEASR